MSDSRIKRDMKDTKTILEFIGARDPFSEDSTQRSIVTGVIADNRVNADKAKEVGQNILKNMTHKNTEEYTFKKDKQAITMDTYMISEVIHKEIQVDPQLLFQRLITVRNYANEDVNVLFNPITYGILLLSQLWRAGGGGGAFVSHTQKTMLKLVDCIGLKFGTHN